MLTTRFPTEVLPAPLAWSADSSLIAFGGLEVRRTMGFDRGAAGASVDTAFLSAPADLRLSLPVSSWA